MIKGCRNHSALVERKIRLIEGFWSGRLTARLMRFARRAPSGAFLPTRCDQAAQRCRGTRETEQHIEAHAPGMTGRLLSSDRMWSVPGVCPDTGAAGCGLDGCCCMDAFSPAWLSVRAGRRVQLTRGPCIARDRRLRRPGAAGLRPRHRDSRPKDRPGFRDTQAADYDRRRAGRAVAWQDADARPPGRSRETANLPRRRSSSTAPERPPRVPRGSAFARVRAARERLRAPPGDGSGAGDAVVPGLPSASGPASRTGAVTPSLRRMARCRRRGAVGSTHDRPRVGRRVRMRLRGPGVRR